MQHRKSVEANAKKKLKHEYSRQDESLTKAVNRDKQKEISQKST